MIDINLFFCATIPVCMVNYGALEDYSCFRRIIKDCTTKCDFTHIQRYILFLTCVKRIVSAGITGIKCFSLSKINSTRTSRLCQNLDTCTETRASSLSLTGQLETLAAHNVAMDIYGPFYGSVENEHNPVINNVIKLQASDK